MSDPLADVAVAEPNAAPDAPLAVKARAVKLAAQAATFAVGDILAASPFNTMAPFVLYRYASEAGQITDVHESGKPIVYNVGELATHMSPVDVRNVLVLLEAKNREAGRRPIFVAEVDYQRTAAPVVSVPSFLPPSPSGVYRVAERKAAVSMPGGTYTLSEGAEYSIASFGRDALEDLVRQGVKLRPYPETAQTVSDRATCHACQTSWLLVAYEGRPPLQACPTCHLVHVVSQVQIGANAEIDRLEDEVARLRAELAAEIDRAATASAALTESVQSHTALLAWAMESGAAAPGDDGTWDGKPVPPPIDFGKMRFNVEATFPPRAAAIEEAAPAVDEATGMDMPAPIEPPPSSNDPPSNSLEGVSSTEPQPFDTSDVEPASGNGRKPPRGRRS